MSLIIENVDSTFFDNSIDNDYINIRRRDNLNDSQSKCIGTESESKLSSLPNNKSSVIYRYKFTEEFMSELFEFSKIHQYDERKDFKEAWKQWTEDNSELIDIESKI